MRKKSEFTTVERSIQTIDPVLMLGPANITGSGVTFFYKDYKDESRIKPTTLSGIEFLRLFCMHILPKRFVKIRYYGILSTKHKERVRSLNVKKPAIKIKESRQERIVRLTGFNYNLCPVCKTGFMHTIEILPKIRAPVNVLYEAAHGSRIMAVSA